MDSYSVASEARLTIGRPAMLAAARRILGDALNALEQPCTCDHPLSWHFDGVCGAEVGCPCAKFVAKEVAC